MTNRGEWIARARDAIRGEGDPDLRALLILEASQHLSGIARTSDEKRTLVRLTRATVAMAGLAEDDLRRMDVLADVAQAWMAFEAVWVEGIGAAEGR